MDRAAAEVYGGMFRMLSKQKVPSRRGFARTLFGETKIYNFRQSSMRADHALIMLGLPRESDGPPSIDGTTPSPQVAFHNLVKLYTRDFRGKVFTENEYEKYITTAVLQAELMGLSPSQIDIDHQGDAVSRRSVAAVSSPRKTALPTPRTLRKRGLSEVAFPTGLTPAKAGAMVLGFGTVLYLADRWISRS